MEEELRVSEWERGGVRVSKAIKLKKKTWEATLIWRGYVLNADRLNLLNKWVFLTTHSTGDSLVKGRKCSIFLPKIEADEY